MEINVKGLSFSYDQKELALDDVHLEVRKGEVLGVIGNTGSGKSTLLKHLNAIYKSANGEVEVLGRKIFRDSKMLKDTRKGVGVVFQFPEEQLFAQSIREDIYFGPRNFDYTEEEIEINLKELQEVFQLGDEILEKSSSELSGGEMRRTSIASVVISKPKVLVLDEPTIGLDYENKEKLLKLLKKISDDGTSLVIVSHDIHTVWPILDRVALLHKGRKVFDGDRIELLKRRREFRDEISFLPDYIEKVDSLRGLDSNEHKALTKEGCLELILDYYRSERDE